MKVNIRQALIFADLHHPEFDPGTLNAGLDYLRANRDTVEWVVLLGDNMNCDNISRHNKGKPGLKSRGGVQREFDSFDRDILTPIESVISKKTKKLFFFGNHEDWLQQWFDENPEFDGAFGFEKNLRLRERGWNVVPQGEHHKIGKAFLLHGDTIGSGQTAAKKLVDSYCATAIMGHVHTASMSTKTGIAKKQDKWVGYTLPTAGILAPRYAKGRPNAFVNGLGIIEVWPNDFVNVYIPIVFGGIFCYGGRQYGG